MRNWVTTLMKIIKDTIKWAIFFIIRGIIQEYCSYAGLTGWEHKEIVSNIYTSLHNLSQSFNCTSPDILFFKWTMLRNSKSNRSRASYRAIFITSASQEPASTSQQNSRLHLYLMESHCFLLYLCLLIKLTSSVHWNRVGFVAIANI